MPAKWVLILVIAFFSMPVHGHRGDRVYPLFEVIDETAINVNDGHVDEWMELIGEPTVTALEFTVLDWQFGASTFPLHDYDPSDLDFRIWIGWTSASERIYVAAIFSDDISAGEDEYDPNYSPGQDFLRLLIDGDHDASSDRDPNPTLEGDDSRIFDQAAQSYSAVPVRAEGPIVGLRTLEFYGGDWWWSYPPYGNGGGAIRGENPVIWTVEFYVTPFDMLLRKEPENSIVSDLGAQKIVGFQIHVGDFDDPDEGKEFYFLGDEKDFPGDADTWMDGLLIGSGAGVSDGSVVRTDSWGRIKASLSD